MNHPDPPRSQGRHAGGPMDLRPEGGTEISPMLEQASLEQVIGRFGPMPPQRAAVVGLAVLDQLVAMHNRGMLHGDVRPGSVLLGPYDQIILTGPTLPSSVFTAPEGVTSPAADLWSLGATLYTAVEGRPPSPGGALSNAGPIAPVLFSLLSGDPTQRSVPGTLRATLLDIAHNHGEASSPWLSPETFPSQAPPPPDPPTFHMPPGSFGSEAHMPPGSFGSEAHMPPGSFGSEAHMPPGSFGSEAHMPPGRSVPRLTCLPGRSVPRLTCLPGRSVPRLTCLPGRSVPRLTCLPGPFGSEATVSFDPGAPGPDTAPFTFRMPSTAGPFRPEATSSPFEPGTSASAAPAPYERRPPPTPRCPSPPRPFPTPSPSPAPSPSPTRRPFPRRPFRTPPPRVSRSRGPARCETFPSPLRCPPRRHHATRPAPPNVPSRGQGCSCPAPSWR